MPTLSRNLILNRLPIVAQFELQNRGQLLRLTTGQHPDDYLSGTGHVAFPLSGLFSMLLETDNGDTLEVAQAGMDAAFWLDNQATQDDLSKRRWSAAMNSDLLLVSSDAIRSARFRDENFMSRLGESEQITCGQSAQLALCVRHHSVMQQLCRWLVLAMYRTGESSLPFTQQNIADRLGVRRESVTSNLRQLEARQVLRTRRGGLMVINLKALIDSSCECALRLMSLSGFPEAHGEGHWADSLSE